jgi:hypothetical protein
MKRLFIEQEKFSSFEAVYIVAIIAIITACLWTVIK